MTFQPDLWSPAEGATDDVISECPSGVGDPPRAATADSAARTTGPAAPGIPRHDRSRIPKRIAADSSDRIAWLRARARGVTATDVAKLATPASIRAVADEKFRGSRFSGNAFTMHGRLREPAIARWMTEHHGLHPSTSLFYAEEDDRHLATPDGICVTDAGILIAEIKTTVRPFRTVPRHYLRQIWWQQYVLGASRTLFVWEEHHDFVPVRSEPEHRWIERDDDEIRALVTLADRLLAEIDRRLDR